MFLLVICIRSMCDRLKDTQIPKRVKGNPKIIFKTQSGKTFKELKNIIF